MSRDKSSIFYALNIYTYLEKYIKKDHRREVEVWLALSGHTECFKKRHLLILKADDALMLCSDGCGAVTGMDADVTESSADCFLLPTSRICEGERRRDSRTLILNAIL